MRPAKRRLLLLLAAAACGRAPAPRTDDGSTLSVLYSGWDEDMFSPSWDMAEAWILYPGLARQDSTGELQPELADRWHASPDSRSWTVHLRETARWDDGVPVTAADLKFTTDLWANPSVTVPDRGAFLDSVVVLDAHTVRLDFSRPRAFPFWWWVYPKHLLDTLPPEHFDSWDFWRHPVGYGPYRFTRLVPRQVMEFEANSDWWGGKPRVDRLVLHFSGGNPLVELMAGNVDAVPYADAATVEKLRSNPDFKLYYSINTEGLTGILWNARNALFSDARVRRALTLALDRPQLNAVADYPPGVRLFDAVFTRGDYLRGTTPPALPHDSARAVALLEQAGWRDSDGDGIRDRNGVPFRFELLTARNDEQGAQRAYSLLIQSQLARYGIRVELGNMSGALVNDRLRSGNFDAVITAVHNSLLGSGTSVATLLGENGWLGYRDPRLLEILAQAARPDARPEDDAELVRRAAEVMRRDLPITFLGPTISFRAVSRRIRGLSSPYHADPVMNLDRIWLEERR